MEEVKLQVAGESGRGAGGGGSQQQRTQWRQVRVVRDTVIRVVICRYVFAALAGAGMAIIYGLKVNLSIAIVAMVNHTALATNTSSAGAGLEDGPLAWSSAEQGAVLGAYFLGYLATQLPGGRLAETRSAKRVFLAAVVLHILPCLATPPAASLGPAPVMLLRLVQGAGGGLSFPALTVLVAAWAPPPQRSSLTAVCFSGSSLGTVASVAGSGWLAAWLGWEAVFYVQGGLACCWCLVWAGLVADTPGQHRSAGRAQGCI